MSGRRTPLLQAVLQLNLFSPSRHLHTTLSYSRNRWRLLALDPAILILSFTRQCSHPCIKSHIIIVIIRRRTSFSSLPCMHTIDCSSCLREISQELGFFSPCLSERYFFSRRLEKRNWLKVIRLFPLFANSKFLSCVFFQSCL